MGKIKGWKKHQESDFWIEYQNDYNRRRVIIKRMGMSNINIWMVQIENLISQKEFKSKQDAKDYAMKYMRANPNG